MWWEMLVKGCTVIVGQEGNISSALSYPKMTKEWCYVQSSKMITMWHLVREKSCNTFCQFKRRKNEEKLKKESCVDGNHFWHKEIYVCIILQSLGNKSSHSLLKCWVLGEKEHIIFDTTIKIKHSSFTCNRKHQKHIY